MGNHQSGQMVRQHSWLIPFGCLLSGGMLLGISTNLAKFAITIGITPLAFLFWSLTGAALLLTLLTIIRRERLPTSARAIEYYIVAALVGVSGSNLIFFSAIPYVGAGFVAMMIALPPLLTYLGALALGIERFNNLRAFGVAAALFGAGVLAAHKFSAPNTSAFWVVIALCGPVLLAIGNIYRTLRWPDNARPSSLVPGMLIAAAALLALVALLPNFSLSVNYHQAKTLAIIAVQSFIFAGQFLLLFLLQKTGGPVLLSLLGAVGAVVGVPVAVFLQGERPPEGLLLGATLIAIGVAAVTWGGIQAAKSKKQSYKE